MKYRELVQFEPIETVIELRSADEVEEARNLVRTFVISARMAENLNTMIFPQLQYELPQDNKGLLVVGNYGTGKSHLMSVISAVAEHAELAGLLSNPGVTEAARSVAGKFKVIRMELGGTTMGLRDAICGEIERGLAGMGVQYEFPGMNQVASNKGPLSEMMAAFQGAYPDHGLLVVVDELLDYLRTRNQTEIILDLNFLREFGEVCMDSRLRFMAGVQEGLFDNPGFQFVADMLRRVKARFEQVRIAREDVAFIVSERLLKKTPEQQAWIREHLSRFAPLYNAMSARMDEFVRLFPIHPVYIEKFEQVSVAEKREILKTLSRKLKGIMDEEVVDGLPGLISYDSYWQSIQDDPSLRTIPDIRQVIDKSGVVETTVGQNAPALYRDMAVRIVRALSVHRLTTQDLYAPIGVTSEDLRDDLCLYQPNMPANGADVLKSLVDVTLKEIVKAVDGRFIGYSPQNGQYYIDLQKVRDYEALITKRAELLNKDQLDRYYFDALLQAMDVTEQPNKTGYRIWPWQVDWKDRGVTRAGYLFYGAPNERDTAHPPRDFYLYFLQPFNAPPFKDEKKPDEVFFRLKTSDPEFVETLRRYAGARELELIDSGSDKQMYQRRANEQLQALVNWMRRNASGIFEVTYQGRVISGAFQGKTDLREAIRSAAANCLSAEFSNRYPDYPVFQTSRPITNESRTEAVQSALRSIVGTTKTALGVAVLEGLGLWRNDRVDPSNSLYARRIRDLLESKPEQQVVNKDELVEERYGDEYWKPLRVEIDYLVVVLAALVYNGDLELTLTQSRKLDVAGREQLARLPLDDLKGFKYLQRPKEPPMSALGALLELFDIPRALLHGGLLEKSLTDVQSKLEHQIDLAVRVMADLQSGMSLWGQPLYPDSEQKELESKLNELKKFLESIRPYNTVAKARNFGYKETEVQAHQPGLELLAVLEKIGQFINSIRPLAGYLQNAEDALPAEHPWVNDMKKARTELPVTFGGFDKLSDPAVRQQLEQRLKDLRGGYQQAYLELHTRARLNAHEAQRKKDLQGDGRLHQLRRLASINTMPAPELDRLESELDGLKSCPTLTAHDLETVPYCRTCDFRPRNFNGPLHGSGVSAVLKDLDAKLDAMLEAWGEKLLENMDDPAVKDSVALIDNQSVRKAVEQFMQSRRLPDPIDDTLLKGIQEVMAGLQRVTVNVDDLKQAMLQGGMPCKPGDLRERIERYLSELLRGKDPSRVRILLQ